MKRKLALPVLATLTLAATVALIAQLPAATQGLTAKAGALSLPAASITFVALPGAGNPSCR
jgi:hypothetical protein